jgi:hypothetical protein
MYQFPLAPSTRDRHDLSQDHSRSVGHNPPSIVSNDSHLKENTIGVAWKDVVRYFDREYNAVFTTSSAKAHLDVSDVIIDGAKDQWRHVLLLDAIVCFASFNERSKQDCERRRFDQYSILRESVSAACGSSIVKLRYGEAALATESGVDFASQFSIAEGRLSNQESFPSDSSESKSIGEINFDDISGYSCQVVDVSPPWTDIETLRSNLLDGAARKSWKKRQRAVDLLCESDIMKAHGLLNVLNLVVSRIYIEVCMVYLCVCVCIQ